MSKFLVVSLIIIIIALFLSKNIAAEEKILPKPLPKVEKLTEETVLPKKSPNTEVLQNKEI